MTEQIALKPCPFCKGSALVVGVLGNTYHPPLHRPQCANCGCSLGGFGSEEGAVIAWNTRATPALPVLEGWKLVPIEPAEGAITAGWQKANEIGPSRVGVITDTTCAAIYRAMLSASPSDGGSSRNGIGGGG